MSIPTLPSPWKSLHLPLLVFATAVAGLLAGCEAETGPRPLPTIGATTPEAKLDAAMERLRSAMLDAEAASGTGVISERTSSYRLIPPDEENDKYRAEVRIKTSVALASAPPAATSPSKKEDKLTEALRKDPEEEASDEFVSREDKEAEEEEIPEPTDNGVTSRAVEQSRQTKTDVYELIYEDDRWTLATELDPNKDELAIALFEVALR